MFKSKTLFIVGAGASCEAGLPAGEALRTKIANRLDIRFEEFGGRQSGDEEIVRALREYVRHPDSRQGDINPYLHKARRIRDVLPTAAISIDNFLDAHTGDEAMELCGKLGIVRCILAAEGSSKLRGQERGNDQFSLRDLAGTWYVRFFQMLTENIRKADVGSIFDNVGVITFNYDRCIERFLVQALADYYELDVAAAVEIVGKLKIYHPYGQVGRLPTQIPRGAVPFGAVNVDLLALSKQIKTFSEGLDDDALISAMHDMVAQAQTVVFLGFAFHPSNMELLRPGYETNTRRVFATSLGLSDADAEVVQQEIFRTLMLNEPGSAAGEPELAKLTCNEFLEQYFRSILAPN